MRRITNILVFVFLYLQCINSEEIIKQKSIYAYKGKILMKNVASDKLASVWTTSGKLTIEDLTDRITFKLDDVKTRIFNGDPETLNSVHEKNIPEDSKIIQEPFVVYLGNKAGYNITHKPNEPIWSLNMKRSIASIFSLNTDRKTNSVEEETNIYGDCQVRYKISNNEEITIWKIIDHKNCVNSANYDTSNVKWDPTAKDFEPIKSETKRIYHFDDPENLRKVESISLTTYQSMPGVRSKQIIEQSQEFTQISKTSTFETINIAELTETSSIIFDYSAETDENYKKDIEKKSPNELISYFQTNYDEFKQYFEKYPLFNMDVNVNDTISYMFEALEQMDKDTLLRLEKKIIKRDDNLLQHIFVSYLPYLGTNDSLNYIKNLVAQDDVLNDLLTIKILATLPAYINNISEEIVEEMEDLMNLKKVANNQVKYAGILSFASIVSSANVKNVLSLKRLSKYVAIYFKNFEDAENYETKMVWLLGLINMGSALKNEDIFGLITNSSESRHIRVLAAYGFKEYITYETPEMYTNMWPIVKNSSEPFEVRVACLDLLLYSQITKQQFNNIVNWYKDELLEPSEQHLANYMYTSLKSLQNKTGYYEYLGDYATETLQQIKPLKLNKAWSTGNYRMAYTDSDANFGMSFQAKLISNPVTNVLNSAFLTVDSFAHSLNFGRYSVYIKAEGVADMLFSLIAVNDNEEATVPKLLELVRKNAYRFKEADDNVHIDVVIFCKDRVVFSMHINKYNVDHYSENPLFLELLSLIIDYNSVSYPVFDYNYFVTDLGTSIAISTDIVEITSYELLGFNQIFNDSSSSSEEDDLAECNSSYRLMWYYSLYTESINPLIDASIATYKYVGEEKRINIPFAFNFTSMLLQWKHEKDAFNIIGDHLIGTMVDNEEVLHEYCENCQQISLINKDNWTNRILKPTLFYQAIGVNFNISYTEPSEEQIALDSIEPKRTGSLFDIMNHHESITFDNFAQPFLLLSHYATYNRYISNDLHRYSVRSVPVFSEGPSETILELSFNSDDNSNDENPITKSDLNVSIALTTRKQHDAEILSHGNLTFRYFSASESNSSDVQPHIHHKYNAQIAMHSNTIDPIKICIDRDVQYPSRRTDKFSLDPVDKAIATTTFLFGDVDNITSECSTENQFYIMEVYSASDKQKALMLASNEYKNCKEQAKGLKYIPPTDDCFAAHEIISKYENCDVYSDSLMPVNVSSIPESKYGDHILHYTRVNDTHAKIELIDEDLPEKLVDKSYALRKVIDSADFLPLMTLNPRVVAYDNDDLEWGFASACYITPNRIRTFTGHTIKKYYEKSADESVAFVECSNTTARGMTVQRNGDKHVGFHVYLYEDTLSGSVSSDGKLQIQFNNETITKTNKNIDSDNFKLYFLDDNVIFISSSIIEIFYTGEYISLQIYSIYNNYICGLCSETQHY